MMHKSVLTTKGREDMARVKLGKRHQVTIPAQTMKRLGPKAGEELELVESEKAIVLPGVNLMGYHNGRQRGEAR